VEDAAERDRRVQAGGRCAADRRHRRQGRQRRLSAGPGDAGEGGEPGRPPRSQAEVPAPGARGRHDPLDGVGVAVLPGRARQHLVVRTERLRRLYQQHRQGARRHELQGLVMPRRRRSDGFTLIELMTVMAIIGVLVAIALPNYRQAILQSKEAVLKEDLYRFRDIIDQYYADKGKYPASLEALLE